MVITIATLLALVGSGRLCEAKMFIFFGVPDWVDCSHLDFACLAVVSQQVTSVAPAYQVSDLPRQPELACATTAVEDALLDCENQHDITHCCSGLDAVYANSSSEAFGWVST
jgi:CMP-N-acetylneuraminic acid synthetase